MAHSVHGMRFSRHFVCGMHFCLTTSSLPLFRGQFCEGCHLRLAPPVLCWQHPAQFTSEQSVCTWIIHPSFRGQVALLLGALRLNVHRGAVKVVSSSMCDALQVLAACCERHRSLGRMFSMYHSLCIAPAANGSCARKAPCT
jgi:hypothetical protein